MTALAKFGLELRKVGSSKTLYREVDRVLSEKGMASGEVTGDIQTQTIGHSLQKMIQLNRHFSVCTIRDCAKVAKIHIPSDRMEIYSAVHCMNWADMTKDYRATLVSMILDDFREILNPEKPTQTITINQNNE